MKLKYLSPTIKALEIDTCCIIANSEESVVIYNNEDMAVDADASLSREEKSSTGSIWESGW
jgi:hypothetical protein